jgi:alcohol dehydrogenase class IV
VQFFKHYQCDIIVAVGGGSAIDVAKCIRVFAYMNSDENYLTQKHIHCDIRLIAVPTTAGTGSEATRFAVIYYNGEKQSVSDIDCIPSAVFFESAALKSLSEYQRKVTMLDALCHAIESYWSVNSTEESREYADEAIRMVFEHMEGYLSNDVTGNNNMLKAANMAGKAINITQTTAGHAMSYKLTSMYGLAHGHAVALCVAKIFPYMVQHMERCIDRRGAGYLQDVFRHIAEAMGCSDVGSAILKFNSLLEILLLEIPMATEKQFSILKECVNTERLKNTPVQIDKEDIDELYHQILNYEEKQE